MPPVVRRPVSVTGSPGRRPSAVSTSGCRRTMPRRASRAAGRREAVSVSVGFTRDSLSRRVAYRGRMPSFSARLRRALPSIHWTRRRVVTWSVVGALVAGLLIWAIVPTPTAYTTRAQTITGKTGPDGDQAVALDTMVYVPKSATAGPPAP